uniref:Uncharacterized protein n=1 Tax=Anguilla anguilla TaxID=7936 RepID=A0A0E9QMM6_ANGAN
MRLFYSYMLGGNAGYWMKRWMEGCGHKPGFLAVPVRQVLTDKSVAECARFKSDYKGVGDQTNRAVGWRIL